MCKDLGKQLTAFGDEKGEMGSFEGDEGGSRMNGEGVGGKVGGIAKVFRETYIICSWIRSWFLLRR